MSDDQTVVVAGRRMLTADVCEFELRRADGGLFEPAEPGSHVTVHTPSGEARSYSLTSDVSDRSRRVIAVRRDESGRGGSRSMVDEVHHGDELVISPARNAFELVDAASYLLVAAGIGITPIRAMLIELLRRGVTDVRLVYLSRSRDETPYLEEITELIEPTAAGAERSVTLHHRTLQGAFDWWPLLETPGERHLYVCGPERLQNELRTFQQEFDRYQQVSRRRGGYGGPGGGYNNGGPGGPGGYYEDDRIESDYEPSRYYREGPNYRERVLASDERVYRGTDGRYYCKRNDGTTGLIVGAIGGGVLGNVIDGGHSRGVGTILGAIVGGVAGQSIDRNNQQIRCR